MFEEIEELFKSKISIKAVLETIISVVLYFALLIIINCIFSSSFLIVILPGLICLLIIYVFIVYKNFKSIENYNKWYYLFRIIFTVNIFRNQKYLINKNKVKELLIKRKILKKTSINQLLEHYRMLIPKSSNYKIGFFSIASVIFTYLTFLIEKNEYFINKRIVIIVIVLLVSIVMYIYSKIVLEPIINDVDKKYMYYQLEKILTELYIEIK